MNPLSYGMGKNVTLSTVIDAEVKRAVTEHCRRRGLKLQFLIEKALIEQLEDEIDLEAYYQRKNEPTIPLEKVIAGLKKEKK